LSHIGDEFSCGLPCGNTSGNHQDRRVKPAHSSRPSYFSSSPLLSPLFPPLFYSYVTLPLSAPFPPPTRLKKSYGEGNMPSCSLPKRISRSLPNPNRDPLWSSLVAWDESAALFRDSTAYLLTCEGAGKVSFSIRRDIVGRLLCLPQGINENLISLRLPLREDNFATIISAYTPPLTSSDESTNKFYDDMHALLATVPKVEKLIVFSELTPASGQTVSLEEECWVPMVWLASMTAVFFFYEPAPNTA
uniref:Tub domain-containing protein n=1 Tax=Schistocephalus solidus TaxID=70667 RepID=A0A183SKK8_SCHSO